MTMRDVARCLAGALVAACLGWPRPVRAQDSEFGIRGLGSPGHWESASSRMTAGAFAAFDALSALADASLGYQTRLTATAMAATSNRSIDLGAGSASVSATRFPLFQVSEPIYRRFVLGVGYSAYLDQTYRVLNQNTIVIRGDSQVVTDELRGDGGVTDLRLAGAIGIGPHLYFGGAIHGLVGSTRVRAGRTFADTSAYRSYFQQGEIRYEGLGASASMIVDFNRLALAVYGRSDGKLTGTVDPNIQSTRDLPYTLGGALKLRVAAPFTLAASATYRNWSVSADSNAYNTLDWSVGAEVGSKLPLRFGVRGGVLPFGPGGQAPKEIGGAAGTKFEFAKGRGRLDLGLEYLERTGTGAGTNLREKVWTFFAGLTIRP